MSADIAALPIPSFHRSVRDAVGSAARLADAGDLPNILILSETPDADLVFISAGTDEPLTSAEVLWLLERARDFLLNRHRFEKVG